MAKLKRMCQESRAKTYSIGHIYVGDKNIFILSPDKCHQQRCSRLGYQIMNIFISYIQVEG